MKIIRKTTYDDGRVGALIRVTDKTNLHTVAKKYSKNWMLPGLINPVTPYKSKPAIFVIKRKKPLKKPFSNWFDWKHGTRAWRKRR